VRQVAQFFRRQRYASSVHPGSLRRAVVRPGEIPNRRRGHDHIRLFHNVDAGRLLFANQGRKAEVPTAFADDPEAPGAVARTSARSSSIMRPSSAANSRARARGTCAVGSNPSSPSRAAGGPPQRLRLQTGERLNRTANSLLQTAKAEARGHGTSKHLITVAYISAGKLTRLPTSPFRLHYGATGSA